MFSSYSIQIRPTSLSSSQRYKLPLRETALSPSRLWLQDRLSMPCWLHSNNIIVQCSFLNTLTMAFFTCCGDIDRLTCTTWILLAFFRSVLLFPFGTSCLNSGITTTVTLLGLTQNAFLFFCAGSARQSAVGSNERFLGADLDEGNIWASTRASASVDFFTLSVMLIAVDVLCSTRKLFGRFPPKHYVIMYELDK